MLIVDGALHGLTVTAMALQRSYAGVRREQRPVTASSSDVVAVPTLNGHPLS